MTTRATITTSQILDLRERALAAQAWAQVAVCEIALGNGPPSTSEEQREAAVNKCVLVISSLEAML